MGVVSHPGDMPVGPGQCGGGSRDGAEHGELSHTAILGVNELDPIGPWSDVKAAGFADVEQHRSGAMQQGEYAHRAIGGGQVEIGHAIAIMRHGPGLAASPPGRYRLKWRGVGELTLVYHPLCMTPPGQVIASAYRAPRGGPPRIPCRAYGGGTAVP